MAAAVPAEAAAPAEGMTSAVRPWGRPAAAQVASGRIPLTGTMGSVGKEITVRLGSGINCQHSVSHISVQPVPARLRPRRRRPAQQQGQVSGGEDWFRRAPSPPYETVGLASVAQHLPSPSGAPPTDRRAPDFPQETVVLAGLTRRVPHLPQMDFIMQVIFPAVQAAATMACQTGARAQVVSMFTNALPLGRFRLPFGSPIWEEWSQQEIGAGRKGHRDLDEDEIQSAPRAPPPCLSSYNAPLRPAIISLVRVCSYPSYVVRWTG